MSIFRPTQDSDSRSPRKELKTKQKKKQLTFVKANSLLVSVCYQFLCRALQHTLHLLKSPVSHASVEKSPKVRARPPSPSSSSLCQTPTILIWPFSRTRSPSMSAGVIRDVEFSSYLSKDLLRMGRKSKQPHFFTTLEEFVAETLMFDATWKRPVIATPRWMRGFSPCWITGSAERRSPTACDRLSAPLPSLVRGKLPASPPPEPALSARSHVAEPGRRRSPPGRRGVSVQSDPCRASWENVFYNPRRGRSSS